MPPLLLMKDTIKNMKIYFLNFKLFNKLDNMIKMCLEFFPSPKINAVAMLYYNSSDNK